MQTQLRSWPSELPSSSGPEGSPSDTIAHLERDLAAVIDALALLGVKRCSRCNQFFSCSDPGALFDCGQLVCFGCIKAWWTAYSGQINVSNRDEVERKLSSWLRKYHHAEVLKEAPDKQLDTTNFDIVTTCGECRGSGKLLEGQRCRFCNGLGTVWIVVPA